MSECFPREWFDHHCWHDFEPAPDDLKVCCQCETIEPWGGFDDE